MQLPFQSMNGRKQSDSSSSGQERARRDVANATDKRSMSLLQQAAPAILRRVAALIAKHLEVHSACRQHGNEIATVLKSR